MPILYYLIEGNLRTETLCHPNRTFPKPEVLKAGAAITILSEFQINVLYQQKHESLTQSRRFNIFSLVIASN